MRRFYPSASSMWPSNYFKEGQFPEEGGLLFQGKLVEEFQKKEDAKHIAGNFLFLLENVFIVLHRFWAFCLPVRVYLTYGPGACGGRKRVVGPLALQLRMTVTYRVGAGNQTHILGETKCSESLSRLSRRPLFLIFLIGSWEALWDHLRNNPQMCIFNRQFQFHHNPSCHFQLIIPGILDFKPIPWFLFSFLFFFKFLVFKSTLSLKRSLIPFQLLRCLRPQVLETSLILSFRISYLVNFCLSSNKDLRSVQATSTVQAQSPLPTSHLNHYNNNRSPNSASTYLISVILHFTTQLWSGLFCVLQVLHG